MIVYYTFRAVALYVFWLFASTCFEVPVVVAHVFVVGFEHEEDTNSDEDWWESHRDQ